MAGNAIDPAGTTETAENIPLYLIPLTLSGMIRKNGKMVYRILVARQKLNLYRVSIVLSTTKTARDGTGAVKTGSSDE